MFPWLDFWKVNFTEPLILSLPKEGLILSWVIQVRGDVVKLRFFTSRKLEQSFYWEDAFGLNHHGCDSHSFGRLHIRPKHFRAFSFWRCCQHAETRDNYHCYLFLTHIPVLSWACTVHLKPMETEVGALGFCFSGQRFLQQCSAHCGGKVPIVPCPYSCEWSSTPAASYLCPWLCCAASLSTAATSALVVLWIYGPEELCTIPTPTSSQDSADSPTHRSDFSSPQEQPVDVLVLQAQQGPTLHHEWHWQSENWV